MQQFVELTKPAATWRTVNLSVVAFETVVYGVFFVGHVHRALCSTVDGFCPPLARVTAFLGVWSLTHLLSVVIGWVSVMGVNVNWIAVSLGFSVCAIVADLIVWLIRYITDTPEEDDGFRLFAKIMIVILTMTSLTKIIVASIFYKYYSAYQIRAKTALGVVLSSEFLLKQFARIARVMNRGRSLLVLASFGSIFTLIFYGLAMFVFMMLPGAGLIFQARTLLILVVLFLPRFYSGLLILANVGYPDLDIQNKWIGLAVMSDALSQTTTLLTWLHLIAAAFAFVIHLVAASAAAGTDAQSPGNPLFEFYVVIYAFSLAFVSLWFVLIDIGTLIALGLYQRGITRFYKHIPRKLQQNTPVFPIKLSPSAVGDPDGEDLSDLFPDQKKYFDYDSEQDDLNDGDDNDRIYLESQEGAVQRVRPVAVEMMPVAPIWQDAIYESGPDVTDVEPQVIDSQNAWQSATAPPLSATNPQQPFLRQRVFVDNDEL